MRKFANLPLRTIAAAQFEEVQKLTDVPVSYTHLDVYKRQIQECRIEECAATGSFE